MAQQPPELQLRGIVGRIKSTLDKAFGRDALRELGNEAITIIRRRTRLGYGVNQIGGKRERLKPLSDRYVIWRKENRNKIPLSPETRPGKSNLTLTGSMLDGMKVKNIEARNQAVTLGFKNRFDHMKAGMNAKRGRVFNKMSKLEIRQLARYKDRELGDRFRKARL